MKQFLLKRTSNLDANAPAIVFTLGDSENVIEMAKKRMALKGWLSCELWEKVDGHWVKIQSLSLD